MATRRAVLAAGAGILLISRTGVATGAEPVIPQTLARHNPAGTQSRRLRVGTTPFPLSHLAVGWNGPGWPAARVRSATGWGAWQPLHACLGTLGRGRVPTRHALLVAPGAVGYEIESSGDTDGLSVTELNTVDGPVRALAEAPTDFRIGERMVRTRLLSRAAWGADESLRLEPDGTEIWPPEYFSVQALTVHHTATANGDPDPAATVRAIYYYHAVSLGWGDIGYHLIVDEAGTVYEGRWSGSDMVPVFAATPGPDGRPLMVNGGHVLGYNAGNVGVALLGDFTGRSPLPAARNGLVAALTALAGVTRLDPLGTTNYVNPISGATKVVATVSGHRDWQPTECPGAACYSKLPWVRNRVAALLRSLRPVEHAPRP